jgi:RNA polymerase sigma-70 factor (ECF subfamily)
MGGVRADLNALIDRLSRRESGRLIGALMRAFGAQGLSFAEDCVQDAFLTALATWAERGVPDAPFAWLLTAARHRALDRLRRNAMIGALEPKVVAWIEHLQAPATDAPGDEELALIVLCCDPALEEEARLALTLKTVCGFTVEEIARAFLATPQAIAQRLVRAKAKLREADVVFAMPSGAGLRARMASTLRTIYLMFTEGYAASEGDMSIREDVCDEALRLAEIVASHKATTSPQAHALCALILFQHARRRARAAGDGRLLMLDEQDRALWDRSMIVRGFKHLASAQGGPLLTSYHLEAGIASVHAAAGSWAATDWEALVSYYDGLIEIAPSPVVEVNRAVALAMLKGPDEGLAALAALEPGKAVQRYLPYHVALGELELRRGRLSAARRAFERALALPMSGQERKLIESKLLKAANA